MNLIKKTLIDFFQDEAKEVRVVIEKTKDISLETKLTDDSRTILELINHIAQIPLIDVDIYSGKFKSGEDTHAMELKLDKKTVPEVLQVFDTSCDYLLNYFKNKSDNELLEKKLRPFYEPDAEKRSWAHFLPKLTAHLALHKGILWAYLKTAEAEVNMFTYYGH